MSDTNMLNELQWIHNGDLSQPVRSTLSSALPLAIENVQLLHAGEYSCRAMLNNGSVVGPVSAGFLNVADSSQLIVPPKQYVLKGGDITLEYSTTLTDNVLGVWQTASSNTPTDPVITNAQVENELAGEYQYNILFYLTDTADQVNTQRQSEAIVVVPPRITAYSQSPIQVIGGSTQSLRVSFVSRTMNSTTVSWTRLSGNMPSGAQVETVWLDDSTGNATTSLNFNSLTRSDSGQYRVSITNSHEVVPVDQRTVSKMFELTVKVPPALPASLSAASINNTRYNITWTLTHTTPDQQASSLLINVSKPSPTIIQVPSSVSEVFVFEVEPGNDYTLSLTAANVDGSVSTDPVVFTTPAAAPLIISADVQRLNSTALSLTFDLHYTGGGDITTISLSVNGRTFPVSDVRSTSRNTWTGMVVSDEVKSLEYSTDLEFSVSLTNQQSLTMVASTRQSFIPPGAPTVQMSVTETSIILQVTLSGIATEPIEYIVAEVHNSTQLVAMTNLTGAFSRGEVVEVTVGGLSPGTQYTAVAYGVNAGGAGDQSSPFTFSTAGSSTMLSQEAVIGIAIVGSVVGTVALVLAIIGCFYCIRRCKTRGGEKYCTADYKEEPRYVQRSDQVPTKNGSFIYHSRGEGTYTPRSPVISSRASSSVPPLGTDYSYEDSEVDIVFPSNELHKRQNDLLDNHSHFQYRHSPAPLKISPKHLLSNSSSMLSPDPDIGSPPLTALSYATDV
ncbi:neural cell adhesion molecule L1.1-like isoform X2 [Halichondria panicea]